MRFLPFMRGTSLESGRAGAGWCSTGPRFLSCTSRISWSPSRGNCGGPANMTMTPAPRTSCVWRGCSGPVSGSGRRRSSNCGWNRLRCWWPRWCWRRAEWRSCPSGWPFSRCASGPRRLSTTGTVCATGRNNLMSSWTRGRDWTRNPATPHRCRRGRDANPGRNGRGRAVGRPEPPMRGRRTVMPKSWRLLPPYSLEQAEANYRLLMRSCPPDETGGNPQTSRRALELTKALEYFRGYFGDS